MAVSHHDATLTSGNIKHHISGRNSVGQPVPSEKELMDLSIVIAMINAWNRLAIGARAVHPAERAKAA